jgi:cytochrome c-type biogenesis protein
VSQSLSLGVAFAAGLLSFLSPCVLPLVPVYIGYLTGRSVTGGASNWRFRILHALLFVLGFGAVFVALGATAGLVGQVLTRYLGILVQVGGLLLIVLGMHMAGLLKLPGLDAQRRLASGRIARPGYGTSLLLGGLFALGWTPCVGPVLAAVLMLAADAHTVAQGSTLLAMYALGLGLPFLAMAAALEALMPVLRRVSRYSRWISVVSGALLVALGFLMSTGLYGTLFGGRGG